MIPAPSTPSAIGGARPTSHSPVRTNSSQLPTPAARISIRTSSSARGRGSGRSIRLTAPPNSLIPAARIKEALSEGGQPRRRGSPAPSPHSISLTRESRFPCKAILLGIGSAVPSAAGDLVLPAVGRQGLPPGAGLALMMAAQLGQARPPERQGANQGTGRF